MGDLTVFSESNSIVNQYLYELRNKDIQLDRWRFRKNIERIGSVMAIEMSKTIPRVEKRTLTPLGESICKVFSENPVIATVLRAGLPLQKGMTDFFDRADLAYISAYRNHINELEFEIVVEYLASPDLSNRILILTDTMLASGKSLAISMEQIRKRGKPKEIHICSVLASRAGLSFLRKEIPEAHFWIGAIDPDLDEHGYILPGLGDAGDLSFGEKVN